MWINIQLPDSRARSVISLEDRQLGVDEDSLRSLVKQAQIERHSPEPSRMPRWAVELVTTKLSLLLYAFVKLSRFEQSHSPVGSTPQSQPLFDSESANESINVQSRCCKLPLRIEE